MTTAFLADNYLKDTVTRNILIISIVYLVISFASNELILTKEKYQDHYSGNIEPGRIDEITSKTMRFNYIKALWEPVSHILSALGTSICIYIGCLYYRESIRFKQVLNIALFSYLIFLIPAFAKFGYFLIGHDLSINDYNSYSFGSMMFLTSTDDPFWLKSLLQVFTLFELSYWILLAMGLSMIFRWEINSSLKLVLLSYVVGLVFWAVARIYIKMIVLNLN